MGLTATKDGIASRLTNMALVFILNSLCSSIDTQKCWKRLGILGVSFLTMKTLLYIVSNQNGLPTRLAPCSFRRGVLHFLRLNLVSLIRLSWLLCRMSSITASNLSDLGIVKNSSFQLRSLSCPLLVQHQHTISTTPQNILALPIQSNAYNDDNNQLNLNDKGNLYADRLPMHNAAFIQISVSLMLISIFTHSHDPFLTFSSIPSASLKTDSASHPFLDPTLAPPYPYPPSSPRKLFPFLVGFCLPLSHSQLVSHPLSPAQAPPKSCPSAPNLH